ncbi:hypothetical protein FB451DRAFT_1135174 [Mycena latifolia]|nr:hypothetical protein FB451DRAFT_1135174 [Mycena latifolia]
MNIPRTRPCATEMKIRATNTIRSQKNQARFIMAGLLGIALIFPVGSVTSFHLGSISFQVNDGCELAPFVARFNREDPGWLQVDSL